MLLSLVLVICAFFLCYCVAVLTLSALTVPVQYFWSLCVCVWWSGSCFSQLMQLLICFLCMKADFYSVPLGTVNIIFIMLELQTLSAQWSCSQLVWGSPIQKGIAAPVWAHFSLSVAYTGFQLLLCSFGELMGFIGNIYLKRKCLSQCLVEWLEIFTHAHETVNTHLANYLSMFTIILSRPVIKQN